MTSAKKNVPASPRTAYAKRSPAHVMMTIRAGNHWVKLVSANAGQTFCYDDAMFPSRLARAARTPVLVVDSSVNALVWRGGRVAEGARLESVFTAR